MEHQFSLPVDVPGVVCVFVWRRMSQLELFLECEPQVCGFERRELYLRKCLGPCATWTPSSFTNHYFPIRKKSLFPYLQEREQRFLCGGYIIAQKMRADLRKRSHLGQLEGTHPQTPASRLSGVEAEWSGGRGRISAWPLKSAISSFEQSLHCGTVMQLRALCIAAAG